MFAMCQAVERGDQMVGNMKKGYLKSVSRVFYAAAIWPRLLPAVLDIIAERGMIFVHGDPTRVNSVSLPIARIRAERWRAPGSSDAY